MIHAQLAAYGKCLTPADNFFSLPLDSLVQFLVPIGQLFKRIDGYDIVKSALIKEQREHIFGNQVRRF